MRSTIAIASTFVALACADSAWRAPMQADSRPGGWSSGSGSGSGSKWNATEEPSHSSSVHPSGTAPISTHPSSTFEATVHKNHTSSIFVSSSGPRPTHGSGWTKGPESAEHDDDEECDDEDYAVSEHAHKSHGGWEHMSSTPVAPVLASSTPVDPIHASKGGDYSGGPGYWKSHPKDGEPCDETMTQTEYVSGYSTPAAPVIAPSPAPYPYMISYPAGAPAGSSTPVAPVAPEASKPVGPVYGAPEASKPVGPVWGAPAASKPVGAATPVAPMYGSANAGPKATLSTSWANPAKTDGPLMANGAASLHSFNAVVVGVLAVAAVVLA